MRLLSLAGQPRFPVSVAINARHSHSARSSGTDREPAALLRHRVERVERVRAELANLHLAEHRPDGPADIPRRRMVLRLGAPGTLPARIPRSRAADGLIAPFGRVARSTNRSTPPAVRSMRRSPTRTPRPAATGNLSAVSACAGEIHQRGESRVYYLACTDISCPQTTILTGVKARVTGQHVTRIRV
jgi:hypothetical protein